MNIERSFLKNKVARRIFFLFVFCALVPISVLTIFSYFQVSKELKSQSMDYLYNSAKIHGLSIYERLQLLETNLRFISKSIKNSDLATKSIIKLEDILANHTLKRFSGIAIIKNTGERDLLFGRLEGFSDEQLNKLKKTGIKKPKLLFKENKNSPSSVYMAIKYEQNDLKQDWLVAQIDVSSLWGIGYENLLPPQTDLCIVNQFRKILVSSFPLSDKILNQILRKNQGKGLDYLQYNDGKQDYYICFRPLFLKSGFDSPNINIILRRAENEIMRPISDFTSIFPLVVLLSVWIVLFLSVAFIRKSLIPLERLKEGTINIANRDFKSQVIVKSGDEFEDLANSFNLMSHQLDRQFEAIITRSRIDRAILSSLNVKKIINTVLYRMYSFFSCNSISINLIVDKNPSTLHGYIVLDVDNRKMEEEYFNLNNDARQILKQNEGFLIVDLKKECPTYISKTLIKNMSSVLVLPIFINGNLKGNIALGFIEKREHSDDDLNHARQIADQVAVALSNSLLLEKLEKLNMGTLEALARTVDAKSKWTSGHSERVTDLSVKISQILGMSEKQIKILKQGAFLHDIGKIGIPVAILNKPGQLTADEYNTIKEHPIIGSRILEPIEAYAEMIPIVLHHHEKFNGEGYPDGIAGEEIALGARIIAVADCYDAIVSDRPYRQGWIKEKGIEIVRSESGKHFDPKVVDAFLTAVRQ